MRRTFIVISSSFVSWRRAGLAVVVLSLFAVTAGRAQESSSSSGSSSSTQEPSQRAVDSSSAPQMARARVVTVEQGGAAVTLETSEALFDIAAALNACGYDADLEHSSPVRLHVREEMQQALLASEPARASRDALCAYITTHRLRNPGLDLGQYVSLALYLSPPPELTPSADVSELPPDSAGVVNVLPLLRTFADEIGLHGLWAKHKADYEAATAKVHDPMTRMILDTNIYLHQPVSSYDGRRFLVLLEPMLSANVTNARIYANDYIVVTSPIAEDKDGVRMDLIRHTYLHYVIEPMVYSRAAATERLLPLLKPVQDAPLEFQYKSDIVALLAECLIKGIEARTYQMPQPRPVRPKGQKTRSETEAFDETLTAYDRVNELERRKVVELDMRQGWVLTDFFFEKLQLMEKAGDGLRDEIGPMIYGMDVDREKHHDEQIVFAKEGSSDVLRGSPRPARVLTEIDRAEMALMRKDRGTAEDLSQKVMADPNGDHGRAQYVLAQIAALDGEPQKAREGFEATLKLSKDPRTLAWSHIYLGRLYDSEREPQREKAIAEYRAALSVRDARPDTKLAAEKGLKTPFTAPRRVQQKPADDDDLKGLDPTGKAEKDAYRPEAPK